MQAVLNVSDGIMLALNENKDEFIKKVRTLAAMEYYKEGKLSIGKAAELAEMDKIDFMFYLGEHNIPVINYSSEDLERELEGLKGLIN